MTTHNQEPRPFVFGKKARTKPNAEKNGSYEQVLRLLTPVISPGKEIIVEQLFTGYGEIKGAKLAFYPHDDIFVIEKSFIQNGLRQKESGLYVFGAEKKEFKNGGFTFNLVGFITEGWDESTIFFDISTEGTQILSEIKAEETPFKYVLKTKKNIKPGIYSLKYYFTYYNGSNWESSTSDVEFKVQNFLERHDVFIGSIAIIASVSAIIRFALIPLYQWIGSLF